MYNGSNMCQYKRGGGVHIYKGGDYDSQNDYNKIRKIHISRPITTWHSNDGHHGTSLPLVVVTVTGQSSRRGRYRYVAWCVCAYTKARLWHSPDHADRSDSQANPKRTEKYARSNISTPGLLSVFRILLLFVCDVSTDVSSV